MDRGMEMLELMICLVVFSVIAVFTAVFTHPLISIALMIVWAWVYKEHKKNE